MAKFHFVEDYERHVTALTAAYPIDEAMSLAVGGHFGLIGAIELGILRHVGLRPGASVFDLGCGSGRLAVALSDSGIVSEYVGTDVVKALLDYAATKCRPGFRFLLNRELTIPIPSKSVDIACAFSVFTHLLHHESFIYLEEMRRVIRPSGRIVFSFLEFAEAGHWSIFEQTVRTQRGGENPPLNQFIERNVIEVWAAHLGLKLETIIDGSTDTGSGALGQATAVLSENP
ncbi:class I SAM-dependent methyltransferase [Rhodopila sp.]|uniref:class I SAM-dependent methyltransferase n=1 Tax=Rhodopila sp. TaxID=2480087 RepID=UPI003D0D5EF5